MCKELIHLKIMKGDPDEAVEEGAHALFFPCGIGHNLGLDVHDMSCFDEDLVGYTEMITRSDQFGLDRLRLAKPLQAGMIITVEPGLYFNPELISLWEKQKLHNRFIDFKKAHEFTSVSGVRLEDDVLVTQNGNRVLGPHIPRTIDEIEDFMRQN